MSSSSMSGSQSGKQGKTKKGKCASDPHPLEVTLTRGSGAYNNGSSYNNKYHHMFASLIL